MAKNVDTFIQIRVREENKQKYQELADIKETTLSELVRDMLKRACVREGIK